MTIEWDRTNLQDLLLYDNWSTSMAMCALAGFDIANFKLGEKLNPIHLIDKSRASDGFYYADCYLNLQRLNRLWESTTYGNNEFRPPSFFINWALSKKLKPEWLDWAINENLYIPVERQSLAQTTKDSVYETDLLKIQQLAILEFFNPRRAVDAKKDEVTQWVKDKGNELNLNVSDNVAEAIFTIIKPQDHNPKIKRVKP